MAMNALQRALVNAGLAEEPKQRKPHTKQFKCHRCKHVMTKVPDSNIMFCEQCGQYFLFDRVM
jgi:rRNA maturation endonuclease Nob1